MAETLKIDVIAKTLGIKSLTDLRSAFQLASQAISAVTGVVKDLTGAYVEQEKQDTQLATVLKSTAGAAGLTYDELKNMAAGLQSVTTFGDESIQSAQSMLLTFTKVGKEVFPEATEAILNVSQAMGQDLKSSTIQIGKALNDPIKGITALSRVGIQLTDDQKNMIRTMQEAGNTAGAQKIILKELETQFGDSAKAARNTFGGALKALENAQGDLKETLGGVIATIGKDFVESMIQGTNAINEFLNNQEKMGKLRDIIAQIGGVIMVAKDIFVELAKVLKDQILSITKNISDEFTNLAGAGNEANVIFDILAGASKIIGIALTIVTKQINMIITAFFNVIKTVKSTIEVFTNFFDAVTGKKKWSEVLNSVKDVGDSFKEFYVDIAAGAKDTISTAISAFKEFPDSVKKDADSLEKTYKKTYDKINKTFLKSKTILIGGTKGIVQAEQQAAQKTADFFDEAWTKATESAQKGKTSLKGSVDSIIEAFVEMGNSISELVSGIFDNLIEQNEMTMNAEIEAINTKTQETLKLYGLEEKSKSEQLANEISLLKKKIILENDAEQKAKLIEQKKELENEKKKAEILEAAEKEKKKTTEKYLKKEHDLRVKAFRANQATQIANVWIAAAIGTAQAVASSMLLLPPANAIMAGILTGLMLTTAGIQTGVIAAQSPPAFATGGIVDQTGPILVGERGPELMYASAGSVIQNADQTRMALGGQSSENYYIDTVNIMTNDPLEFFERLKQEKYFEMGRV